MRPARTALILFCCLSGCRERPPESAEEPVEAATPPAMDAGPAPPVESAAAPVTLGAWPDAGDEALIAHLSTARIHGARILSRRSMGLRVALEGDPDAVFKPRRREEDTARHEVAFYRLARLLGTGIVPVSTIRRVFPVHLDDALRRDDPAAADAFLEAVHRDPSGMVEFAVIEWLTDLGPAPFDGTRGVDRLVALLALTGPRPDEDPLVAPASEMVVLDYLAGNWDRFTGGNLFTDADGRRLILIDNNASFDRWSEGQRQRMEDLLGSVERFSRSQVERLRLLDGDTIESVMGEAEGDESRPLLNRMEIERLLERRDELLEHIDGLAAGHGLERVLSLP